MEDLKLWLDSYNDIYSDFDSRHFLKRRISEDFLQELRLALKSHKLPMQNMILYLPLAERKVSLESDIEKSMKNFFEDQYGQAKLKTSKKLRTGISLVCLGISSMLIYAYLGIQHQQQSVLTIAKVILEPAGWFMIWTGMDALFYDLKKLKKEMQFFQTLAKLSIQFQTTEE